MQFELIKPINENLSPLEQVFYNRDYYENMEEYLNTTDENIHSPFLLRNMERAINLLQEHLAGDKMIYVQVDSDNDGMASAALLLNYLHRCMPEVVEQRFYWGLHNGKYHGIDLTKVALDSTSLVIVPDASSNEYDLHAMLAGMGVDVLILDHHDAEYESGNAVVVNNQLDNYPNKTLCGAGVVWKFCQALDEYWDVNYADDFRDLAAWAIIADMMDLRDYETRQIIKTGLTNIKNPLLEQMVKSNEYLLKDGLTPHGISFSITPYINAMMRVGDAEEKALLFEAMLEWKSYEEVPSTKRGHKPGDIEIKVAQATRICTNVKNRQTRAQEAALEEVERLINAGDVLKHKIILVKVPGIPDANLLGLNANKIMAKYKRPVMLLRKDGESWTGSARNVGNSAFVNFREFCAKSGYTSFAEGHGNAFGVSIPDENVAEFLEYSDEQLADIDFSPAYKVDFIFSGTDFNPTLINNIAMYKMIWGQGVPEPKIAFTNIVVHGGNCILMSPDKKPTLKIQLANGVECIKFRSSEEEHLDLVTSGCTHIDIIGTCGMNVWNGRVTPQIIIEDYEIVNKQEYYF